MNFEDSATRFAYFLQRVPWDNISNNVKKEKRVGFIISPWMFTQVPWYSITLALLYRMRGFDACLIWDDLVFEDEQGTREQNIIIGKVLDALQDQFTVQRLSNAPKAVVGIENEYFLQGLSIGNAIRATGSSVITETTDKLSRKYRDVLDNNLSHILGFFRSSRFDHCVVPGGVYSNSGLFLLAGRETGTRMATFDSGPGSMMVGVDDAATHQMDIPKLLRTELEAFSPEIKRDLLSFGVEELERRKLGKDLFNYQKKPYGLTDRYGKYEVVIPYNVEWDSTQLNKHRFFYTGAEWIIETVQFILEYTDAKIAVRQHPAYNQLQDKGELLTDLLKNTYGNNPRFRFISYDEEANSYELIEEATVVLPATSTIGLEAVILGKPVIVETSVYYATLPFIQQADSKEDYFRRIKAVLSDDYIQLGLQEREDALLCYGLVIKNQIYTDFTPQPDDFVSWTDRDLEDIAIDRNVNIIVSSMSEGVPAALLNCQGAFKGYESRTAPPPVPSVNCQLPPTEMHTLEQHFPDVSFGDHVQVLGIKNITIGEGSCIGGSSWLNICIRDENIRMRIGSSVLVGRQGMISTGGHLEIGDYCVFAPRVYISDADHIFTDIMQPILQQGATINRSVIVEENCWLGINTVISGNLTVGRGSVVGANAVVTRDVPPFSVVVGNPSQIVKMYSPRTGAWERTRSEDDIQRILEERLEIGIPSREEYQRILKQNARISQLDPVLAGRGNL